MRRRAASKLLGGWDSDRYGLGMTEKTYTPDIPQPDPAPRAPAFDVPKGAWDTHFHVIDRRHGFVDDRSFTPHDATVEMVQDLHRALGIDRGTFVQVSVHGTNNKAMLDALREVPTYRGVCVVDDQVRDVELDFLHQAGVRGARVNVLFGGGVGFRYLRFLAEKIARQGWHLQMLLDITDPELPWDEIEALPCPVVIDHMGHWNIGKPDPASGKTGVDHPAFLRLLSLVAGGAWVKLSGAERLSTQPAPPFDDVVPIAQALITAAPDRCVWGTDWPHVLLPVDMPNDGALFDQLAAWAPDEDVRHKILVDNPTRLYTEND